MLPTSVPSPLPTTWYSTQKSKAPSQQPTPQPSGVPTMIPSPVPTMLPSPVPTPVPTPMPTPSLCHYQLAGTALECGTRMRGITRGFRDYVGNKGPDLNFVFNVSVMKQLTVSTCNSSSTVDAAIHMYVFYAAACCCCSLLLLLLLLLTHLALP